MVSTASSISNSRDKSNDNHCSRLNNRASSSDSDKSSTSVRAHGKIVLSHSLGKEAEEGIGEHGGNGSSSSGQSGGYSTESFNISISRRRDSKGGTGVESIPSEQEDECSKNLKRYRVRSKLSRHFKGVSVLVVETSNTGSEDDSGNKSGGSSSHVDNSRSSEIDHTNSRTGVIVKGRKESNTVPDSVYNTGVNESGKEEGVTKVGNHLTTFGNGSCHNSGSSDSESELEEEIDVVSLVIEEETTPAGSNEGSLFVSNSKSYSVESKSSTTCIKNILEHDILHILLTDGSSTEHGETHRITEKTVSSFGKVCERSLYVKRYKVRNRISTERIRQNILRMNQ